MTKLLRLLAVLLSAVVLLAAPMQAGAQVLSQESWIEEWDPASGQWVRVADQASAQRLLAARVSPRPQQIAQFGPFAVLDARRAALVGATDAASPHHFAALLAAYPATETLVMIDGPGTDDDRGNLAVGRMIRANGIATHVPAYGSVRSGAVELFLAGATRIIEDGAEFAVHSWRDDSGREASDYAAGDAVHRTYLDYYAAMGMSREQARAFYAMTNSVAHDRALWLDAAAMRGWIGQAREAAPPRLAYLDTALLDTDGVLD